MEDIIYIVKILCTSDILDFPYMRFCVYFYFHVKPFTRKGIFEEKSGCFTTIFIH